jgi:hypothetical protein
MSIPFYCSAKKTLDHTPTDQELQEAGGLFIDGRFHLNNGVIKTSSSGACKACLNREGQTNEWQGPEHVFVLVNGQWIKFGQSDFYRQNTVYNS